MMKACPTALYKRTSAVIRAASYGSRLSQSIARDAERAVRSGNCASGRKMLLAAIRIIKRDRKVKGRGF